MRRTAKLSVLTPQSLRLLRTLVRYHSVAHAARRLHCSQSALLEQILQLQCDLGGHAIDIRGDVVDVMAHWRRAIEDLGD